MVTHSETTSSAIRGALPCNQKLDRMINDKKKCVNIDNNNRAS